MISKNSPRFGFCCKWIDNPAQVNGLKPLDEARKYNTGTTTVAWLNRQKREISEQKLWDLMEKNIESTRLLVERVSELPPNLRMVRLSSDILPCYTHHDFSDYWRKPDVVSYAETAFKRVGDIARDRDVRLSFHPGQFTVLASSNPGIVERSIEEFEYHVNMARWMGYGSSWHDHGFKINVHLSGQGGIDTFLKTLGKLTPEARNLITIENDEISNGLDSTLLVANHVALVLDIHHHWVNTGEYISLKDDRVQRVVESWRDVRPTLHYSVSREDILSGHDTGTLPNLDSLLGRGFKKQKLRAHSDFYWNSAVNNWALSFGEQFDIQCEAKGKNLARDGLIKQLVV
jgi:UV DNA damage repair endonuclease